LFTGLFLLNVINPMAIVFLTDFRVSNRSSERVLITPVGAVGKQGWRKTLPLSLGSFLSIPSPFDRSFPLGPGEERTFTYDWDDIQFSEILVVPESGEARELIVDTSPTERQYRRVATNYFAIPELERLPPAKPEVRSVLDRPSRSWVPWSIALFGLLPPIGIVYSARKLKTVNKTVERSGAPPVISAKH